jgi:hypothetical protein
MAYGFSLHTLRSFVAMVLVLQPHPAFRSSVLCPQEHCVYLPVTSNPPVVTINEIQSSFNKGGGGFTFGEVINNSNSPVYNVIVQVGFYNLPGVGYTNTTLLTATLPGQVNLFTINHIAPHSFVSDSKVLSWDITPTVSYSNLTVVASHAYTVPLDDPTGERDFYAVVTGTLRNDTSKTLKDMQIYVWNVAKTVSNRQTTLPVAPGATVTFSAALGAEVLPTDTIRIVAQGVVSP